MNSRLLRARALILLTAAVVLLVFLAVRRGHAQMPPTAAAAQAPLLATPIPASTLKGVVLDPAGKPVPRQALSLHRVNGTGGAMVDSATTDAQGRFTAKVPEERDTSAVYFAATRWNGELFIGTPFKPPVKAGSTYTVTVGVNPVNMGPAAGGGAEATGPAGASGAPLATPAADSSTAIRWFVAIVLALIALGAIGYALVGAARERARQRRREILARIAALDERAQSAGGDEAARLERERAELVAELTSE